MPHRERCLREAQVPPQLLRWQPGDHLTGGKQQLQGPRPSEQQQGGVPDASADRAAAGPLVEKLATTLPRPMPTGVARANVAMTAQKRFWVAPESTMEEPSA